MGKEKAIETPVVDNFSRVKPRRLSWLWPNRIPLGKMSLLVGIGGVGKSFLSLYMAAQVSTGRPWIDGRNETREPASVFVLTAEDDIEDTVVIRLKAAGANLNKVYFIKAIKSEGQERGLYNLTSDGILLWQAVRQVPDTKLVIIDPISAYMEGKNENKNAEVREFLSPLISMAQTEKLAVLGISHLNKNQEQAAINRVIGSAAFINAVRAAWLVQTDRDDIDRRLFVHLKGNLGVKPTGLAYRLMAQSVMTEDGLEGSAYCAFEPGLLDITADELLAPGERKKGRPSKRDDAGDWLLDFLEDGPKDARIIVSAGKSAGYSQRTLETAKKKLDIQSIKMPDDIGSLSHWEWALPTY